jgi:hypothetical protein
MRHFKRFYRKGEYRYENSQREYLLGASEEAERVQEHVRNMLGTRWEHVGNCGYRIW